MTDRHKKTKTVIIKAEVLQEDCQVSKGVEYPQVTVRELGDSPLLQMVDYGLRRDEAHLKGKLRGKVVEIRIDTVRSIFAGRPQVAGMLLNVGKDSVPPAK